MYDARGAVPSSNGLSGNAMACRGEVACESIELKTMDTYKLVMDVAFLTIDKGHWRTAEKIFKNLTVAMPADIGPYVGLCLAYIAGSRVEEMLNLLENEAIPKHPQEEVLVSYLGVAYVMNKEFDKANEVLSVLAQKKDDSSATRLAKDIMQHVSDGLI